MLDSWIIEKIKEKEKEQRPQIRLPLPEDYPCQEDKSVVESEHQRGVVIIKINGDEDGEES